MPPTSQSSPGAAEGGRRTHAPSNNPVLIHLLAMALILFAAFALRLWNLGAQSLWHDEAWSIFSAYHPLATGTLGTDPNAPAVFYLSLGAWMQLLGDGVWALRYWSLLIGLLTVAVAALVANRFFGRRVSLIAALLVALSPLLWTFSQEIRAYEAMPFYALTLLGLVEQLLRKPGRRAWLWLLLVEILALYTQNLGVPLIAWLNVTLIGVWLYRRRWSALRHWFIAQFVLALAYLPWLLGQSPTGTALNTTPPITVQTVVNIYLSYFTGVKALLTDMGANVGFYWPFYAGLIALTAVVLIGLLSKFRGFGRMDFGRLLVLSQVILLPVLSLIELYAAHIDFHPRYFILGAPGLLLFMGVVLGDLSKRGRIGQGAAGIGLLAATATTVFALSYIAIDGRFEHDDFRAIADRYAALGADDAIIIPYNWEPTLDYYSHKLNFKAQIVGIPLGSDWRTIISRLNAIHATQVELLTWYQLPADVRGAYACLLGAATEDPPAIFTVNGLSTARYYKPNQITVSMLTGPVASFGALNQEQSAIVANDQRACVIDGWFVTKNLAQPIGVNVQLNNPLGWPLGQASSDLRTDQQLPTQFWKAGQSGTSFNLIDFPNGLPPGEYPLVGSVYDSLSLHKLDILNTSGAPAGQLASLGMATLAPADLAEPPKNVQTVSDHWQVAYASNATSPDDGRCTLQPGQQWQISATWWTNQPGAQPQNATIRASSDDWPNAQPGDQTVTIPANRQGTLSWAAITIPASVKAPISLSVIAPDGQRKTLVQCVVKASDHLFSTPAIGTLYSADFPGVGTLSGFDWSGAPLSHADFRLTLYWKASGSAAIAYTVFVHLLNATGQVIAQNDSPPANASRPTTGWVDGEYVIDPHTLTFNAAGQSYSGPASLEVGLYDPATGHRVKVNNGADHVSLPALLTVK